MVDQDRFKQLITKYQTSQLNVAREYLQHLFLSYFYQLPQTSQIYFKGGTALRFVYQSPRFSQDLDFSTNQKDVSAVEDCLLEVLAKIEKENIQASLQEAKTTTGGYLSTIDFVLFNQTVPIQIEISFREKDNRGEVAAVTSDFIPSYTLVVLSQKQLIFQKMRALHSRQNARDFYDLYFILRKQLPIPDKKTNLAKALTALHSSKVNFEVELKQFLPKSHWLIIKDFKTTLAREISRN